MKILPCMAKEIVWLAQDGKTVTREPFQVFLNGKTTIIRIGNNTIYFDEDGRYDGIEQKMQTESQEEIDMIMAAYEQTRGLKGLPPDEPYFQAGTPGYAAEVRAWATAQAVEDGKLYAVAPKERKPS